jgi:TPR repeat protein
VFVYRAVNPTPTSSSADFGDSRQIPDELIKLFEAAKEGNPSAQERVGRLYLDGPERARDERKAFFWIRRAAISGDQNAQYTLGRMYETGRGVRSNVIGAYVWYKIAMASGSDSAREAFGNLVSNLSREQIAEAEQQIEKLRRGQKRQR